MNKKGIIHPVNVCSKPAAGLFAQIDKYISQFLTGDCKFRVSKTELLFVCLFFQKNLRKILLIHLYRLVEKTLCFIS